MFYILFKNLWNDLEDLFHKMLPMPEAANYFKDESKGTHYLRQQNKPFIP